MKNIPEASSTFWWKLVFIPCTCVLAIDQWSKQWSSQFVEGEYFGPFFLKSFQNFNFMLGSGEQFPELYRYVLSSTVGGFLLFVFLVAQYLFPIKSKVFRMGLSIFFAGVFSNTIDKVRWGYVVDFFQINVGSTHSGIMNLADVFQWVGAGLIFFALVQKGDVLWPENERRGKKWIDSSFQGRYCLTLMGMGFAVLVTAGFFSTTFLSMTLKPHLPSESYFSNLQIFLVTYGIIVLIFMLALFVVGRLLSHRLVGPIQAFTRFLDQLEPSTSTLTPLKLRENDEFRQLEDIASRFQNSFYEKLGMEAPHLVEGMRAPGIESITFQKQDFDLKLYRGKKVWICLYRYATCPLCVYHLHEIDLHRARLKKENIQPIIVFESQEKEVLKDDTGESKKFLQKLSLPIISDPEKKIYKKYRTRSSLWKVLRPSVVKLLLKAKKKGFLQGSIDGDLGQIPAHILVDESGFIVMAYYGAHIADHIPWDKVWEFAERPPTLPIAAP